MKLKSNVYEMHILVVSWCGKEDQDLPLAPADRFQLDKSSLLG